MAVFLSPTAIRALLLAGILALAAAWVAPAARGAAEPPAAAAPSTALLADEWSWHEFLRYWQGQLGSMKGVVGTVVLVCAGAFLIIMSKGKW